VNVSPSGRFPHRPCSQKRPSEGVHFSDGEKVATRSVPSDVWTAIVLAWRATSNTLWVIL